MKKNKGGALIYVLVVLIAVSILGLSIATLTQNNILQARVQKENREGYYLARSGVELMYEHLKKNNLMDNFINNNTISGVGFSDYEFAGETNGKVDVTVSAVKVADTTSKNKIVTIVSRAKLNNSNNDEVIKLTFELVITGAAGSEAIDLIRDFKWSR